MYFCLIAVKRWTLKKVLLRAAGLETGHNTKCFVLEATIVKRNGICLPHVLQNASIFMSTLMLALKIKYLKLHSGKIAPHSESLHGYNLSSHTGDFTFNGITPKKNCGT